MDGILIVNKPKGITSRDVVNIVVNIFNTKKIGHTGTLDPIATGVLVLCIGKATKLVDVLTGYDKEYVATVKLGILTDTLDTNGKLLKKERVSINKEQLEEVLNSFVGTYNQEVPIYSAVKINGKKLYEYAREKINIKLPKRMVSINDIELLELNNDSYKFKVKVSKGTYIRSLIRDINDKLGIIGAMDNLQRVRQGEFDIKDSYSIDDIKNGRYRILSVKEVLEDYNCIAINKQLYNKIKNGMMLDNTYDSDVVVFIFEDRVVAVYKKYEKDINKIKPYKMFI